MKIGISLPWSYLSEIYRDEASKTVMRDCSSPQIFLEKLKTKGVSSIELRHWEKDFTEKEMNKSFFNIASAGLQYTVHGDIYENHDELSVFKAFPWLQSSLENRSVNSQKELIITIHPLKKENGNMEALRGKTEKILDHYCNEIDKYSLPVKIAYENQREKGFTDPALHFESISETVMKINRKMLGTCWDMGHSYANYIKNSYKELPDPLFLKKAIHTHIHDLSETTGATHWPLIFGLTPVEKYINTLEESGYRGIYNLELSAERFSSHNVEKLFFQSIEKLVNLLK